MTANLVQVGAAHKFWWRTATATICMGLSEGETMATTGLTTVPSYAGPSETMTRLEAAINAAGMTVFARIDHGAAAAAAHVPLGPTELVIFGNAKGGTPLMQTNQAVGIDLPLKAVICIDLRFLALSGRFAFPWTAAVAANDIGR